MSSETRQELRRLALASRARFAGFVVFAAEVDGHVERHLDARVWAQSGLLDRVERLQVNGMDNTVFATELDGLVG